MESSNRPMVFVIDDDAATRKSLLLVFDAAGTPARAFDSAEAFLEEMNPAVPGCIVVDLDLPGMNGIDLLQRLRGQSITVPVIIISAHADVPITVRAMKLGAEDVFSKPIQPEVIIQAVRQALTGCERLQMRRVEQRSIRQRFGDLTPRESEMLALIVDGQSNKQIAMAMGISVKTVANHRAHLMAKSGAINAADLARLYTLAGVGTSENPFVRLPENAAPFPARSVA